MIVPYWNYSEPVKNYVLGGFYASALILALVLVIIFAVAFYIYHALAWYEIGKKQKYKHSWFAWVPILQIVQPLQMGGFHWAWIFLLLIPFLGWAVLFILLIISWWKIFEKGNYPGWFSVAIIIPKVGFLLYAVVIGFVAWGKGYRRKSLSSVKRATRKRK